MATYKYRQEYYSLNVGNGVIKYNITPDGGIVGPGTKITINGQISGNTKALKSIGVSLCGDEQSTYVEPYSMVAYINKSIAKGATATFTISFTMSVAHWQLIKDKRTIYYPGAEKVPYQPIFFLGTAAMNNNQLMNESWGDGVTSGEKSNYEAAISTVDAMYNIYVTTDIAPAVYTPDISDEAAVSALTVFGNIVTYNSKPRISGSWTYDSHYPDQSGHVTLTLTGAMTGTYEKDTSSGVLSAVFDLPTPEDHGTVNWTYAVTDMFGNTATATGNIEVKLYYKPAIRTFYLERYDIEQTSTGSRQVPADDGEHIWLSLLADIASVNELNAWNSTMTYWKENDDESDAQNVPNWNLGNTDGETIDISNDDEYLASLTLAAQYGWRLRLTITDALGYSDSVVCDDIQKAGAVFDVEPNGVAVGMRSTATELEQKFECAYPTQFYKNVAVPASGLLKVVSAQQTYSLAANTSLTLESFNVNPGNGWTKLCVVGFATGNGSIMCRAMNMSSNTPKIAVRNVTSSAVSSATATIWVLCIRTEL